MTNPVHIVATPLHETSPAKGIGRTRYLYTRYVNKLHGRSGHLWQNRFFSCSLDEPYLLNTIRYVERNVTVHGRRPVPEGHLRIA